MLRKVDEHWVLSDQRPFSEHPSFGQYFSCKWSLEVSHPRQFFPQQNFLPRILSPIKSPTSSISIGLGVPMHVELL